MVTSGCGTENGKKMLTMPKMTIRIIMKSGVEFSVKCNKFTITRNGFDKVTGYNIQGITENKPIYLDWEQVAAVVRVLSDEHEQDEKRKEGAENES